MRQEANERSVMDHTFYEWVGAELNHAETFLLDSLPLVRAGRRLV